VRVSQAGQAAEEEEEDGSIKNSRTTVLSHVNTAAQQQLDLLLQLHSEPARTSDIGRLQWEWEWGSGGYLEHPKNISTVQWRTGPNWRYEP
jgi:hypothetical protein